jgi:signal peptidase II
VTVNSEIHPRQPVRQHGEHRTDAREQEHRRDRKLDCAPNADDRRLLVQPRETQRAEHGPAWHAPGAMTRRHALLFASVALLTIGCDRATKIAANALLDPGAVLWLAAGWVRLELVQNAGAFMSLGSALPDWLRMPLLIGLVPVLIAAASLLALRESAARIRFVFAAALLAGGGIGNWLDRLAHHGVVTDFVSVGLGPIRTGIFNVADLAVVAGALLLFLGSRSGASGLPPDGGARRLRG